MGKKTIWPVVLMFLVYGCATTTTFSPVLGLDQEKISSRSVITKISKESDTALEKKGYAYIGSVQSKDEIKTCWGIDCDRFTCTHDVPHKDTTKEVLEKASANGGDLVILQKDSTPLLESITKEGKCLSGRHVEYSVRECDYTNYSGSPRCWMATKQRFECLNRETIDGKKCTFISSGTVWRYDPEMAKRLAELLKEQKEKQRIEIEKKRKAEKEAAIMMARFKSMERDYTKNYPKNYSLILESSAPFPVKVGGKYGFKDRNGKMVIEPQFIFGAEGFVEGLAAVAIGEPGKIKWGFIDKTGKWVIHPCYEFANHFSEGLSSVRLRMKYGYIDKTGTIIIEPQFDKALPFYKGLAVVKVNGKYGYIDKNGHFIIKAQFDFADPFVNGIAQVEVGGKKRFIDKSGETIAREP